MPELVSLGPQVVFGGFQGRHDARHAFHHAHPSALQRLELFRIVRHQPHRAQAEESQDGSRQLVAAQVGLETELLIGLHGVGALVLQFIGAQLVEQADNIFSGGFLILSTWETVK